MKKSILMTVAAALLGVSARAEVVLPEILSDDMVLQQQTEVCLWGKAMPNGKVTVAPSWTKTRYSATCGDDGKWEIKVATPAASYTPYTITVSDKESKVVVKDVLVGEVWYCSGQSNMEMPIRGWSCPTEECNHTIATAGQYKGLRVAMISKHAATEPREDVSAKWQRSTMDNAWAFSATAYFFARMLTEALDVPVGVIVASWGGSKVEGWLPNDIVESYGEWDLDREFEQAATVQQDWQWNNHTPCIMYNAMYYPLRKYTVKGFLWYQGESNVGHHEVYAERFATMANIWRENQGGEQKPVFLVEIAPWQYGDEISGALLRESQEHIPQILPNSGVVCTNDLVYPEEQYQIHPRMKRPVGERLAYWALNKAYGHSTVACQGPTYRSMEIKGNEIELCFDNAGDGVSSLGEAEGFEVAGEDKVFHPAKVRFSWDQYRAYVSSEEVPAPVAVRYCFRNFQIGNVFGMSGLPLVPFRTDNW